MEEQKNQKLSLKKILVFLNNFLKQVGVFWDKYKSKSWYMIPVAVLTIFYAIFLGYKIYVRVLDLESRNYSLKDLLNYNITTLKLNSVTKKDVNLMKTIDEIIIYDQEIRGESLRYKSYLEDLQVPYTYLMKNIFLPSLNIWKDPYLWTIDTDLIWEKFLKKNPYDDILLLSKWSDFFKYVGNNNETNEVKSISVWDIQEMSDGYFKIPVSVSFVAHSKRSFLLLVDKLSVTSNEKNISLIDEFLYNLWLVIKDTKQSEIQKLSDLYNKSYTWLFLENQIVDQDKVIGFAVYRRVFQDEPTVLVDEDVLFKTIKKIVMCEDKDQNLCLFQFREKYRAIPRLAYFLQAGYTTDSVKNFKLFIKNLPPVLKIKTFSFDKMQWQKFVDWDNIKYEWKVELDVYWKGISQVEVSEIALLLWKLCFKKELALSPSEWVSLIDVLSSTESYISTIDSDKWNSIRELRWIFEDLVLKYPQKTNYQKVIVLFEIYRMLTEANLCEV